MGEQPKYVKGLEGIIATESKICKIDGMQGLLSYRGYRIEDLVKKYDFEQIAYLLLEGGLPDEEHTPQFCRLLRSNRAISDRIVGCVKSFPAGAHPMAILQAVVPLLGAERRQQGGAATISAGCGGSEHLIAQFATVVAAIHHIQQGTEIIPPRSDLNHGANFLYMLSGNEPSAQATAVMDTCLTLHAEHSLNASTFTARVVSSTMADCYAGVSAAVGSLSGPLHGGANEQVLEMVSAIGTVERVHPWVDDALAQKKKIMGMGHRVYKAKDPRAIVIERLLATLSQETPSNEYDILKAIEQRVGAYMHKQGKPIYANVDFFSGAAYQMLGIPTNLFTSIFAIARIAGWMAHIREQMADNRIYRPKALYTGPAIVRL